MTGPKLNEGATVAGERVGTRAVAKYVRSSASKARVVLDLIRGLPVNQAADVLRFSERAISHDIGKVLDSAIANAVANDLQDPDELFVAACFADEGPTLRRFRPRARGRATRIRKRTCHITVIVDRMSDRQLEIQQQREASRGTGGGASARARRERVERSRQRAQALKEQAGLDEELDETVADDVSAADTVVDDDVTTEDTVVDDDSTTEDVTEDETATDETETTEPEAAEDASEASDEADEEEEN